MKKRILLTLVICICQSASSLAAAKVKLVKSEGGVYIRRGVEEDWLPASTGAWLYDIDSILTGEGAQAVLELAPDSTFTLGPQAILDIAELRTLTEQNLFLRLMSKKIRTMERGEGETKLRAVNVHVAHGELKSPYIPNGKTANSLTWHLDKNGALALYEHAYVTNSILKLNNIFQKYGKVMDCGEIHYLLGRSFETLHNTGQALDAYNAAVSDKAACEADAQLIWIDRAQEAIHRLGSNF